MLTNNPEFQKHFKLEASRTRLTVSSGLLLLAYLLVFKETDMSLSGFRYFKQFEVLFGVFSMIGFFVTALWGAYLASSSINDEIRQKTWDFVRMSSLAPSKILIGKLFGSTSLVWIIGLTGALPVIAFSGWFRLTEHAQTVQPALLTLGIVILSMLCLCICMHAWALLVSLYAFLMSPGGKERQQAFGISAMVLFFGMLIGIGIETGFNDFTSSAPFKSREDWYGISMPVLHVILMCILFSAFWLVTGAYRVLRRTLKFRDLPLAWIGFLFLTSLFLQGFKADQEFKEFLVWPLLISLVTMSILVLYESHDIVGYKTFAARYSTGNYTDAARHIPLWMISAAGLVISMACSLILISHTAAAFAGVISLLLFITRDVLMLHYIVWNPNSRRPVLGFFVYAFVMYFLLPMIFEGINKQAAALFFPVADGMFIGMARGIGYNVLYWIVLLLEITLAAYLFRKRWLSAFRQGQAITAKS